MALVIADRQRETYLGLVFPEEDGRVHAVGDGASDPGEPGEDDGGLIGVGEEELLGDVPEDGEEDEGGGDDADLGEGVEGPELVAQRARDILEDAHVEKCCPTAWRFRNRLRVAMTRSWSGRGGC